MPRPPLPKGQRRVVLAPQRVAPQTLAELKRRAKSCGGIGRAIDAAVMAEPFKK